MRSQSTEVGEGPLADRLVQVALELLAEDGVEALTLRSVARRAGVSHGAPARHFRSLADLLAEVAATGFRMLSEAIEKSDATLAFDAAPQARLSSAGRAYVECALAHPGLFALMFRHSALDPENEALARDGTAAFERLLEHVRVAQSQGWHRERDPSLLAGSLWVAMHGLATLWSEGAYPHAVSHASLDDALNSIFELVDDPNRVVAHPRGEER